MEVIGKIFGFLIFSGIILIFINMKWGIFGKIKKPSVTMKWNPKWIKGLKWFFGIVLFLGLGWFLITRVSCGNASVSRHESPVYVPSADTTFVATAVGQQFFISKPYKGMVIEVKNSQENSLEISWYAERKDFGKVSLETANNSVFYKIKADSMAYMQIKIE